MWHHPESDADVQRSDATSPPNAIAERLTAVAAVGTFTIGLLVFIGWAADVEPMRRLFLGDIHMLPNTSIGFMAGGASLWMMRRSGPSGSARVVARGLALLVFALGVVTFAERMWDWSAGIDLLLFADLVATHPYRPLGRMATNSTIAFILGGGALLLLDGATERVRRTSIAFATIGLAIASLAMMGYLYGAPVLYSIDRAAGMALVTALAFSALHAGILVARPGTSWVGQLIAPGGGGVLARRLLLALTIVPPVLGWLFIRSHQEEVVSREVGIAIFVVAMIAIQLTLVLRAARIVQAGQRAQQTLLEKEAAARDEAERANRAKNDFLAVMSHELRTPLNAIMGYGALLREGIPDPVTSGQRHQLDRIGASARHLLALIDEVLTLSRLELGQERVTPAATSITTLVEDTVAMVEPDARRKGLALQIRTPEPDVTIVTDAGKLRQALLNLVGNAVKFTDSGDVVVRVSVDGGGEQIVLEVEDSGLGIAPQHLAHVFDAFWQVDQAPTRVVGGSGLGLHVTRRLVRLLGGETTVRSVLGQGSCFTIRVPRTWWGALDEGLGEPLRPSSDSKRSVATEVVGVVSSDAAGVPRT